MFKKYCFFLLFSVSLVYAQKPNQTGDVEKIALSKILKQLEKEYEVRFSFDPNLIAALQCLPFLEETNLEEKLAFLKKETQLLFEKINQRYIVIKEQEPATDITICGFLVDELTREPIQQATVWILGKSIGTSTDDKGFFELKELHSDWIAQIDYLGYQSQKAPVFKLQNTSCSFISLKEANEELDEVLISDYLTQGMVKKNDGAIQVSPRKLAILPGLIEPDVLQSLQLLPGIQSPNGTATGIHVRGSTPDQNLILFDGIKMYQTGHFFGLISSFNPYVTQKIALYRSGTKAKYGDRIGGVLDISSGEEISKSKVGFGVNMTHADAFVKTPLFHNKIGLVFSARRSLTDVWNSITYQKFSESVFQNTRILEGEEDVNLTETNNTFYFNDYNLKLIAKISKNDKLVFSNLYNNNQLTYAAENEKFHEEVSDNIGIKNRGFDLKWTKNWSKRLTQELDISNSSYTLDYTGNRIINRQNESESTNEDFGKYNTVEDFGIHYNLDFKVNEYSTISGGYQFTKNKVQYVYDNSLQEPNNVVFVEDPLQNKTHAFYAEHVYKKNKWFVSTGLRSNYFSKVGRFYLEPRVFVSNQLTTNFQLKASGEIKNQVVSQLIEFRNIGLGFENDIWVLSDNDEIPVLNSKQISVGLLYQKKGWNLDVDFYQKNISGLTLLTEDLITVAPSYLGGTNKILGMDFLLKKRFGNYRSWISYTLSSSDFTYAKLNSGNSFTGTYDIPHSLVWSHTYSHNKFQFSLGWKVRSGSVYTQGIKLVNNQNNPDKKAILFGDINAKRLPTFQKFDFSTTYKFKFSKDGKTEGKIGLSLLNILNTKNILDRAYEIKITRVTPGTQGARPEEKENLVAVDRLSIGFTPNVVFRVNF
ncbi:TonB-dependent receptor [Flavicella sediminum]|uniref:TonB-dependent receptor n=1 Tax=Flavicella sediminum TaxID=2585141 RepID=UPI00112378D7|nr:carboxypeptidase-like regulatory domain-containing protein [Flavicella sediminum]